MGHASAIQRKLSVFTVLFISAALISCGKGFESVKATTSSSTDSLSPLELQSKAVNILQTKCSGCHTPVIMNGGLGDVTNTTYLMAEGWVVPGGAANSILFDSVSKDRMPEGTPLSADEKSALQAWIIAGLPNLPVEPIPFKTAQVVLKNYCFSCHSVAGSAGSNLGGINLETFANVRARVVPGKPYESGLFDAVIKKRMPIGDLKLPIQELAILYSWIYAGAVEN